MKTEGVGSGPTAAGNSWLPSCLYPTLWSGACSCKLGSSKLPSCWFHGYSRNLKKKVTMQLGHRSGDALRPTSGKRCLMSDPLHPPQLLPEIEWGCLVQELVLPPAQSHWFDKRPLCPGPRSWGGICHRSAPTCHTFNLRTRQISYKDVMHYG